jgi:hypothetical protein
MFPRDALGFGLRGDSRLLGCPGDDLRLRLRRCPFVLSAQLAGGCRLQFVRLARILNLLYRDDAGIFRHLNGLASGRRNRLSSRLPVQFTLGIGKAVSRLPESLLRVLRGAGPPGNLHRVPRFVEFQRDIAVEPYRLDVGRVDVQDVLASL